MKYIEKEPASVLLQVFVAVLGSKNLFKLGAP